MYNKCKNNYSRLQGLLACLKERIVAFVTARRLNEYIRHYETLSYPVEEVHRSHLRAKRSINRDSTVTLKFRAHGRDFHIRLKRDLTTFSNNLIIEGSTGEKHYDSISHIYLGNLVGMFTKKNTCTKFNRIFLPSSVVSTSVFENLWLKE